MEKPKKSKLWRVNGVLVIASSIDNAIETYRRTYPRSIEDTVMALDTEITSVEKADRKEIYYYEDLI